MSKLYLGNCLDVMKKMTNNSVDSVITDPPYGLNFMGKDWDYGVPGIAFWKEALRVAKPGATLMAFGGTRTVHRLACAIEDAGWIIRDRMQWIYGSGFPKSHNISKAIDKAAGVEQEAVLWDGWGTALKPAHEPIVVAMKPIDGTFAENAQKWGVAGLWIDGGRVAHDEPIKTATRTAPRCSGRTMANGKRGGKKSNVASPSPKGRWPANIIHDGSDEVLAEFPQTKSGGGNGRRTEQPNTCMSGKNYARVTTDGLAPSSGSAARFFYCAKASKAERNAGLEGMEERLGAECGVRTTEPGKPGGYGLPRANFHPTVKPLALMRYLCRLTKTPTGGIVLDPFMGSGTTGVACANTGREFVGIELDKDYFAIAEKRIKQAEQQMRLV